MAKRELHEFCYWSGKTRVESSDFPISTIYIIFFYSVKIVTMGTVKVHSSVFQLNITRLSLMLMTKPVGIGNNGKIRQLVQQTPQGIEL